MQLARKMTVAGGLESKVFDFYLPPFSFSLLTRQGTHDTGRLLVDRLRGLSGDSFIR